MKALPSVLASILGGLVIFACAESRPKTVCELHVALYEETTEKYCKGRFNECWLCNCWILDRTLTQDATGWKCTSRVEPPACTGDFLLQSSRCIEDASDCKVQMMEDASAVCKASQM